MSLIPYKRKNTIIQSSPFNLIEDLQSDLNRFFNNSVMNLSQNAFEPGQLGNWLPTTDVHDDGDKLVVQSDMPGLEKKDMEVSIQGNTLFIRGEKKHHEEVKDMGYLRSERFFGQFERAIPLTEDINPEKIDASYNNGVLSVTIQKKEEAKPKQVKVNIK